MARRDTGAPDNADDTGQGGSSDNLFQLGLTYATGDDDTEIDLVQAHKWFNLAALRGNDEAKRYRSELTAEMTKAQVATAQRLARSWLTKH